MKRIIFALIFALVATLANAQEVTFTTKALSRYVVVPGMVPQDEPVSQSDLNISFKNGCYGNVWVSTGFDGEPNGKREVDYTFGCAGKRFDVGVYYFDLNRLFETKGGDIIYPYAEIRATRQVNERNSLTPYFRFELPVVTEHTREYSSVLASGGLRHTWRKGRLALSQDAWLMYTGGVFGSDKGLMHRYQGIASLEVGGYTVHLLQLRVSVPVLNIHDRETKIALGTGVSVRLKK